MNAIIGMTDLVLDEQLTSGQREYLTMVRQAGDDLLSIINDILDFSKIEAGRMELYCEEFDLYTSVTDTVKSLASRLHGDTVRLTHEIDGDVPRLLIGDRPRLCQILVNLIGNAIKFTSAGSVSLQVSRATVQEPGSIGLSFAVRDTGIGIPREKVETIFDAFAQADSSSTRTFGGTGLGLSIATKLVELMGGNIEVESEPGSGSCFRFTACFKASGDQDGNHDASVATPSAVPQRSLHVLLVEDSLMNQKLAAGLLKKHGHTVTITENGLQAIAAVESEEFDVVLMDVQMPEMDGLEATTIIRARLRGRQRELPIIALTAHAIKGDRETCLAAGMDEYVSKPINQAELFNKIYALVDPNGLPKKEKTDEAVTIGIDTAVDWGKALDAVNGDRNLLKDVVQAFLNETPQLLSQIRNSAGNGNVEELRRAAHTIKGSLRFLGSAAACETALYLEETAYRGEIDSIGKALAELESEVENMKPRLVAFVDETDMIA